MFSRRGILQLPALFQVAKAAPLSDRDYWVATLRRIAEPVLTSLSQGKLRVSMPVEASHHNETDRKQYTYLEAIGRLLTGMAPWLESGPADGAEGELRRRYADLARASIAQAVDPGSPDFMNFSRGAQPVVDAAFLAQAILRAPTELWKRLDGTAQANLLKAFHATRVIQPGFNNWLLFSAMVEACLCHAGEDWDRMRVDYAIRQHEEWYKGDGLYGDGPVLHWDYYNSFVIQPMLLEVMDTVSGATRSWESFRAPMLARARRYAAIQERLISPEGTYPAIGRSLAYRFGAFQVLALMAMRRQLPESVSPEQVRCALTAVIRRSIEAPGTFDANGWLTIGLCGHQSSIGEAYISTGSLYLCSAGLLPLGLPRDDVFWSGAPKKWTSQKVFSGEDVAADHAISG
ncbi:MAG TPA: DUF2264 domain-containing protein [Bryobacteraceae bacterium]|jgi:hypothetical protein